MGIVENSLQNARMEWVEEDTVGVPPTDPEFNKYSDYIASGPGWDGSVDIAENEAVGSGDIVELTRGQEEHGFAPEYWLQRAPVDGSGDVVDPIAASMLYGFACEFESHTIVYRRSVDCGGNFDAGFRMYTVGLGQKPLTGTIPGDPGESSPQSLSVEYDGEYGRSHVIHQPDTSTTLDVINNGDTEVDVTVEDEGASTSETLTVAANSTETTLDSYDNVDVIWVESEHEGTINVTDGSGTDVLDQPLQGITETEVDAERGIPPLGTGSHANDIGNDPERFLGLNAFATYGGGDLAERLHSFDLSVELDSDDPAVVGTRQGPIDEGGRTVTLEADVSGPWESTKQALDYLHGVENDLDLLIGGTTQNTAAAEITLTDAQPTDVDEQSFGAGDANFTFGVTFTAQGDQPVSVTNLN